MKIINSFVDEKKGFFKDIIKMDKNYDYYLGLVVNKIENVTVIQQHSEEIYNKSNKNVKLLKICDIDISKLLIFEINSEFVKKSLNGVLLSISKYLEAEPYTVSYMKTLQDMVFNTWGDQFYFKIKDDTKEYDLRIVRGDR